MAVKDVKVIHDSGAEASTTQSAEIPEVANFSRAAFYLDVTVQVGTTLDVTIEELDPYTESWFEIGAFTQAVGVTSERIVIDPIIGTRIRAVYTIAGGSFTFSLTMVMATEEPIT